MSNHDVCREEGRECGAPVSRISRCMAPSQALFNFEVMRCYYHVMMECPIIVIISLPDDG